MNRMNTASVGLAVTPTVIQTFITHYLNRKPLHQRPTAHLSYDEGLHLIRTFLEYVSQHTVEDLQTFTAQWVPHPTWIKVDEVNVPAAQLDRAAGLLEAQLGPEGLKKIGGRKWWQWRKPEAEKLEAEWIEMRADYNERKKKGGDKEPSKRVMLYIHGGAYFFGSVDMHRYQMQRHARKLKARVFAPDYRLAPQFPFPCGLQDCLAAYLHLLATQDPKTLILAGDSAGGGMVLSILCILRDQGIPLPAGAILISPWCDLTHSFPSVAADAPFDYIPQHGFHHKPSAAWPPPNNDELRELKKLALEEKRKKQPKEQDSEPSEGDIAEANPTLLTVAVDGKSVELKEQIQMYATNELIAHPLVSPVMQPTLGGLPPLLIMVGGGECLRDEQIYVAHKCADPAKYMPPESTLDDQARAQIKQYKPTDVQLQVWDDLCHVAPTLSFTKPAKHMYRSVAQFGAWALARAQKTDIEILDDGDISVITSSSSSDSASSVEEDRKKDEETNHQQAHGQVGKAGDTLPPFKNHMIRQRVTRHGVIFPLPPASALPGCTVDRALVGTPNQGPVKKWLAQKRRWDQRFASSKKKVHRQFVQDLADGYEGFGEGELPPPSALAGRRKKKGAVASSSSRKRTKSMGLALWSLWGSKHDKATMVRERDADERDVETTAASAAGAGRGARSFTDVENQETAAPTSPRRGHRRVTYTNQDDNDDDNNNNKAPAESNEEDATANNNNSNNKQDPQLLSPGPGVVGSKRAYVDGVAVPFSIKKEAETASMMTLTSSMSHLVASPRTSTSRPLSRADVDGIVSAAVNGGDTTAADGDDDEGKASVAQSGGGGDDKGAAPPPPPPNGVKGTVDDSTAGWPGVETSAVPAEKMPTIIRGPYSPGEVD